MNSSDSAHPTGPSASPDGPAAAVLAFHEATKVYPGRRTPAVSNLSLEVPAGEICVLIGPSGSGKTTAMQMVNRLITITDGRHHDRRAERRRPRRDRAAPRDRLRHPADRPVPAHERRGQHRHRAAAARLGEGAHPRSREASCSSSSASTRTTTPSRYPAQLSGGQRQRVGVARAMAADPPLMLMDEPFGAVDPITRDRLQNDFLRLHAEVRKTVIFVTHDIDEAIKMGDRIAILRDGELAQYDTPDDDPRRARPTTSSPTSWAPTAASSACVCARWATSSSTPAARRAGRPDRRRERHEPARRAVARCWSTGQATRARGRATRTGEPDGHRDARPRSPA